jgi:hypothetical protein
VISISYWSSENPRLTQEDLLHPVKVGVWYSVSPRRDTGPVFFNEAINCGKICACNSLAILFRVNRRRKTELPPMLHAYQCRLRPMSSSTESSAVEFGQHVHPVTIFVIFSSGVV